jgi:hypothetical protein
MDIKTTELKVAEIGGSLAAELNPFSLLTLAEFFSKVKFYISMVRMKKN